MNNTLTARRVAIQGIKGCFHEMAARKYYDSEIDLVECDTFRELCYSLKNGECDTAIMAIENTLAGSLLPNYALIQRHNFFIIGEVYLRIKMNLMSLPGTSLNQIKEVISHPVALSQCEDFLEGLESIKLLEYHDTAAAAALVKERNSSTSAAIASYLSAELYGLEIISEGIETHKKNYTRFLILSRDRIDIENSNKASISLEISHTPGSLSDVLLIFKEQGVNLTKIQSVPIIGKPYQYAFKIDLQWKDISNYHQSIADLKKMGCEVQVLGEYMKSQYDI